MFPTFTPRDWQTHQPPDIRSYAATRPACYYYY